jgi:hypothetical protein
MIFKLGKQSMEEYAIAVKAHHSWRVPRACLYRDKLKETALELMRAGAPTPVVHLLLQKIRSLDALIYSGKSDIEIARELQVDNADLIKRLELEDQMRKEGKFGKDPLTFQT